MADDGFHEIQLNGKQLVFLFMATTVVSVVIFLCGVLVGRGVRAEQESIVAGTAEEFAVPLTDEAAADELSESDAPADVRDEPVTYPERLANDQPPVEQLTPEVPELEAVSPASAERSAPAPTAVAESASAAGAFTIQVAALKERPEADALVEQLVGKGYDAYVLEAAPGTPTAMYRVRVGHYRDRGEAEPIVRRLEREEQFKPWITR
jgi:cell division septation protein DedD